VLLQKTMLNIEGLGRQLYPDLDLWKTAKPFLERWTSEQVGTRAFANRIRYSLPRLSETLPELPDLVHRILAQAAAGKLRVSWESKELAQMRRETARSHRRLLAAITGSGLIISASVLSLYEAPNVLMLGGAPLLTWVLGVTGAICLFVAWKQ
jgi:ubiquinone biosynthesis protein